MLQGNGAKLEASPHGNVKQNVKRNVKRKLKQNVKQFGGMEVSPF